MSERAELKTRKIPFSLRDIEVENHFTELSSGEALPDIELRYTWMVWEHINAKGPSWADKTKPVLSMSSLKEFWWNFRRLPQPSSLFERSDEVLSVYADFFETDSVGVNSSTPSQAKRSAQPDAAISIPMSTVDEQKFVGGAISEDIKKQDAPRPQAFSPKLTRSPASPSVDFAKANSSGHVTKFTGSSRAVDRMRLISTNFKDIFLYPFVVVESVMIFRSPVFPEWEAPENRNGGHIELVFGNSYKVSEGKYIDQCWNNLVLAAVGDALEPKGMLTGIRYLDKMFIHRKCPLCIRVEVWFTLKAFDEGDLETFKKSLASILGEGISLTREVDPSEPKRPHIPAFKVIMHQED